MKAEKLNKLFDNVSETELRFMSSIEERKVMLSKMKKDNKLNKDKHKEHKIDITNLKTEPNPIEKNELSPIKEEPFKFTEDHDLVINHSPTPRSPCHRRKKLIAGFNEYCNSDVKFQLIID